MAEKLTFEDFKKNLDPWSESFIMTLHEELRQKGYNTEIKPAAQGPVASYLTPKTKHTVFNYVFRKSGIQVRIYGDKASEYQEFFETLPGTLISMIDKAPDCKRYINLNACNQRCSMGCNITVNGKTFKKCRYGAFMFPLNPETAPYIKMFIEKEVSQRQING